MSDKSKISVLVVDDESILREIYSAYLKRAGYSRIVEAGDGMHAWELCQIDKFDLITLDHKMPKMNGADFLKKLRSDNDLNKNTPVIMISGFLEDFKSEVELLGNVFFGEKPLSHENFLTLIQSCL